MQKKSKMKFKRLIALAINLQFILPTASYAKGNTLGTIMDAVGTVGNAYSQQTQQMQMQQMSQMQKQSLSQSLKMTQVDPNQVPALFSQNGCIVVKARSNSVSDMCDNDKYDPEKARGGYYTALQEISEDNKNEMDNFLTAGNQRFTTQGIGCFDKSITQFNAQLKARVEALNKLEQDIESQVKGFKKLAEKDLEEIKKNEALITGKPAKYLKDFKFEDQFRDKQCRSISRQDSFKTEGATGGFTAIQTLLDKEKSPSKGMGPADLIAKTADIKKDIRKIASRAAKYAEDSNSLSVTPNDLKLRTSLIDPSNNSLNAILADVQSEKLQTEALTVMGGEKQLADMMKGIDSKTLDLDSALFDYENQSKSSCLTDYLASNFGGVDGFVSRLEDPTRSKKMNAEADSGFKNNVEYILNQKNTTVEYKLRMIKQYDTESNTHTFKTGKTRNIGGKKIGASTRLRASDMIEIYSDNCVEKFNKERVSNGRSKKSMVQALKKYKSKRNQLQAKFIAKMKNDIIREMEQCPSDSSTGSAENSCGDALNTNGKNFCVRTANLCANNISACHDKANKIMDKTKATQQKVADRYNQNMKSLKQNMAKQFVQANKIMEATARQLDGMYSVGSVFKAPIDLKLNMLNNKFLKDGGINAALQIEDPDQYLADIKKDIQNLKKQVIENHKELMDGPPDAKTQYKGILGEAQKYKDNLKAEQDLWKETAGKCLALVNRYNSETSKAIAEENKATDEYNEKLKTACREVDRFNEHPAGFCGKTSELADQVAGIASSVDDVAIKNIGAFERVCDSYGSQSGNTHDTAGSNDTKTVDGKSIAEFCSDNDDFPACTQLVAAHGSNLSTLCIKDKPIDLDLNDIKVIAEIKKKLKQEKWFRKVKGNYTDLYTLTPPTGLDAKDYKVFVGEDKSQRDDFFSKKIKPIPEDYEKIRSASSASSKCVDDVSNDKQSMLSINMIEAQQKVGLEQSMLSHMGGVSVAACNATMNNGVGKTPGYGQQEGAIRGIASGAAGLFQ